MTNSALGGGVGSIAQVPAETVARVPRVTTNIHKAIATNQEVASQLEQRLHAVLLPQFAEGSADAVQGAPRPVTSPLASDLETFESQLYALSAKLTDLMNRLEI